MRTHVHMGLLSLLTLFSSLFMTIEVSAQSPIIQYQKNFGGSSFESLNDVQPTADGGYKLTQARRGDTVGSVLRYVHFDAEDLLGAFREKIAEVKDLDSDTRRAYLKEIQEGLDGYTYLEE